MSKKTRKKKKDKLKIQRKAQEFSTQVVAEVDENDSPINETIGKENKPAEDESIIDAETRKLISKDVRMIILTVVGLVMLLAIVKILQLKTGYIGALGDWLYKIANIQTM